MSFHRLPPSNHTSSAQCAVYALKQHTRHLLPAVLLSAQCDSVSDGRYNFHFFPNQRLHLLLYSSKLDEGSHGALFGEEGAERTGAEGQRRDQIQRVRWIRSVICRSSLSLSQSRGQGEHCCGDQRGNGHSTAGAALCHSRNSPAGQRPQGLLTSTGTGSVSMSAWLANRPALSTSAFRWG